MDWGYENVDRRCHDPVQVCKTVENMELNIHKNNRPEIMKGTLGYKFHRTWIQFKITWINTGNTWIDA